MSCLYTELWTVLNKTYTVEFVLVTEGVLAMFTGYAKFVEGSYNTLVLWQVLYLIGWLTLYRLTECIINECMDEPRARRNCFRKTQKYDIPEDRGLLNYKCMY